MTASTTAGGRESWTGRPACFPHWWWRTVTLTETRSLQRSVPTPSPTYCLSPQSPSHTLVKVENVCQKTDMICHCYVAIARFTFEQAFPNRTNPTKKNALFLSALLVSSAPPIYSCIPRTFCGGIRAGLTVTCWHSPLKFMVVNEPICSAV